MKKILIVILFSVLQIYPLKAWTVCKNFFDYYHFSLYDLELQLIYAINHDQGLPVYMARFFHNKLLQFMIDIYKRYTHFLDWQLLITLLSFAGVVGVILAIWYFLEAKKRDRKIALLIIISFVTPLLEVFFNFHINFLLKIAFIAIPFNLLSFFGHFSLLNSNHRRVVFLFYFVVILLSISWMILIPNQAIKYCEMP